MTRTARLTASSAANAMAQIGKRGRRGVDPASINPGTLWRWRSISDFFRASRMKDMNDDPELAVRHERREQRRARLGERGIQHHLCLQPCDAVDVQPVLALKILDRYREPLIVHIV